MRSYVEEMKRHNLNTAEAYYSYIRQFEAYWPEWRNVCDEVREYWVERFENDRALTENK